MPPWASKVWRRRRAIPAKACIACCRRAAIPAWTISRRSSVPCGNACESAFRRTPSKQPRRGRSRGGFAGTYCLDRERLSARSSTVTIAAGKLTKVGEAHAMRVMAPDRGILKLAVRVLITVLVGGCAPQISGSDSDDADLASAGRYDGRWFAVVPAQGGCNFSSQLTIDVHGRSITGAAINPQGRFPLNGTV